MSDVQPSVDADAATVWEALAPGSEQEAALTRLVDRARKIEAQRPSWVSCDYGTDDGPADAPTCAQVFRDLSARAEAAEARVTELEQALDEAHDWVTRKGAGSGRKALLDRLAAARGGGTE